MGQAKARKTEIDKLKANGPKKDEFDLLLGATPFFAMKGIPTRSGDPDTAYSLMVVFYLKKYDDYKTDRIKSEAQKSKDVELMGLKCIKEVPTHAIDLGMQSIEDAVEAMKNLVELGNDLYKGMVNTGTAAQKIAYDNLCAAMRRNFPDQVFGEQSMPNGTILFSGVDNGGGK